MNKFLLSEDGEYGQFLLNQTPRFANNGKGVQILFKSYIEELKKGVFNSENISYTY